MNCPNCGLANSDNAKFCANCGTPLGTAAPQYQAPPGYQASGPYQQPAPARNANTLAKNIGIGCLILIVIFLFFGLSCTRACFRLGRHRTYIHRRAF